MSQKNSFLILKHPNPGSNVRYRIWIKSHMVLLKLKIIRFITAVKNQASLLGIGNLNLTILILTKNKTSYLFKTNKVQNAGLTSKET